MTEPADVILFMTRIPLNELLKTKEDGSLKVKSLYKKALKSLNILKPIRRVFVKFIIPFVTFFSLIALGVEPGPTPKNKGQEKVEAIRQHGGALKIQKTPAHIEGLHHSTDEKEQAMQKDKNGPKKTEEEKEEVK